ncbi:MAG: CpaF family protein [Deltaproteobacteria bacterium]|nr:MAG: CpaF family protein [Deltaproteobacteria bacterium]TNF24972.1 MAG: CpaF family protein [Deltaproteobacteria bacterium]
MSEAGENTVWSLVNELASKKGISEIVINGPKQVFVERNGQFIQLNVQLSKRDMYGFINEIAAYNKKECNEQIPILDGNMPDGSRINCIIEPYASGSPSISIRRYMKTIKSFDENPGVFDLTSEWVEFLKAAVSARMNIVVSGGTGVGKTTFMNLLLKELSPAERVVTIEDTIELSLNIPNVVRLESKAQIGGATIGTRDLVKNTLRMRPDRIIIGEIRGGELFDLLQAMNTGHDGSMTSVHANNPGECIQRLETLFLLAGFEVPFHVVRRSISTAVDLIIQVSRNREGKRVISQIQEITGMEGTTVLSQTIAAYEDDKLEFQGIVPKNMAKLNHMGGLPIDFFGKAKQ